MPISFHGQAAAPAPSQAAPPPWTRTHCLWEGAPGGLSGHGVERPSFPLPDCPVSLPAPTIHLHGSASLGPLLHPLLLFHLPNYQAKVAIWFALFLYVKYPPKPVHQWVAIGLLPLNAPLPTARHRKQVRSGVWFEMDSGRPSLSRFPPEPRHAPLKEAPGHKALLMSEDMGCSWLPALGPPATHSPIYSHSAKGSRSK